MSPANDSNGNKENIKRTKEVLSISQKLEVLNYILKWNVEFGSKINDVDKSTICSINKRNNLWNYCWDCANQYKTCSSEESYKL